MGALVTRALRPIKSFNIENRAHRVISKEKPTPAPRYPQNIEDLKRTLEADPNIGDKLDRKDSALDDRLKDVYVTSHGRPEDDITREKRKLISNRPLPQDRKLVEVYEFGFKEPERIKYGHTTLRHTIDFISAHQTNPEEVTVAKIAIEYKMSEKDVESILKYFKTYEVYLPETKKSPALFAGPATMRKQLIKSDVKEIESKETSGEISLDSKESGQIKVANPRSESMGAASVGAASLGARRNAPVQKRTTTVRSDERPIATQGDLLNSIKFQRRYRDLIRTNKLNMNARDEKGSKMSSEIPNKPSINNIHSRTSTRTMVKAVHPEYCVPREKPRDNTVMKKVLPPPRPPSPTRRRNAQTTSFY